MSVKNFQIIFGIIEDITMFNQKLIKVHYPGIRFSEINRPSMNE